jgi:hypothetical protein
LGDAHAPDEDGGLGVVNEAREFFHARARETGLLFKFGEVELLAMRDEAVPIFGEVMNESGVVPIVGNHDFQDAVDKRDVAALRNGEPVVGEVSAEEGAVEARWHPIALHAGFEVGIYENDFGAELFGFVEIFRADGLIIGGIGAEKNDEVRAIPIFIAAGGGGNADGVLHGGGGWGVTEAGGVVDVVGPEKARDFLGHVINFVGHAARGQEKGEVAWI